MSLEWNNLFKTLSQTLWLYGLSKSPIFFLGSQFDSPFFKQKLIAKSVILQHHGGDLLKNMFTISLVGTVTLTIVAWYIVLGIFRYIFECRLGIWSCEDDKDGWSINSVLWNFQVNDTCKAYTKTMRILTTEVILKGNTELSDMQGAICPLGWLKRRGFNMAYNYGGGKNRG